MKQQILRVALLTLLGTSAASVGACGPATGSEGGSCHNASFDATSCDKGLECIDTCTGGGLPPIGCGLVCQACEIPDANGDCPGVAGEGEGEGEGAGQ